LTVIFLGLKSSEKGPSYPFYFPYYDVNEKFPPTEIFGGCQFSRGFLALICSYLEFTDPGTCADPAKPHLLTRNTKTQHISPYLGTEISGIQISELAKEGLDELALFTAERKVIIFRDQDFKDLSPERQIEIVRYVC
jgi:sulfonate dioxygenase